MHVACLKKFGVDEDGGTGKVVVDSNDRPVAVQGFNVPVDGRQFSVGNVGAPRHPQLPERHSTLGISLVG